MFTIAYALFIFVLSSSTPLASTGAKTLMEFGRTIAHELEALGLQMLMGIAYLALSYFDKTVHAVLYLGFTLLVYATLVRAPDPRIREYAHVLAFLIAVAYGLTDEMHQAFVPGRTASIFDVVADTLGALAAQMLIILRKIIRRVPKVLTTSGDG